MAAMMIGIDPHKGSHTAVAIDESEQPLGELRVRSSSTQVGELRSWAKRWPERIWAVEGAGGLGYLVAQQLLAAGERVVDIQPKLGARVRLLATGATNKNDPNDARSVAIAALRSPGLRAVSIGDHAEVLRLLAKRNGDIGDHRTQVVCRLWKVELAKLAKEIGLEITVAHYPPGTSKWNLHLHELAGTTTCLLPHHHRAHLGHDHHQGAHDPLRTRYELLRNGTKVSNAELAAVPLSPHEFHGEWNYTIAQSNSR